MLLLRRRRLRVWLRTLLLGLWLLWLDLRGHVLLRLWLGMSLLRLLCRLRPGTFLHFMVRGGRCGSGRLRLMLFGLVLGFSLMLLHGRRGMLLRASGRHRLLRRRLLPMRRFRMVRFRVGLFAVGRRHMRRFHGFGLRGGRRDRRCCLRLRALQQPLRRPAVRPVQW